MLASRRPAWSGLVRAAGERGRPALRAMLDLLFPPRCPACREILVAADSEPLCRGCRETLVELPAARCLRCGEPEAVPSCPRCAQQPPGFERADSAFLFGGALTEVVHRFKYEDRPHYAGPLARLALPAAREHLAWATVVAPIPLHRSRMRARGYDQALLLARALARAGDRRLLPRVVRRVRDTPPQVGRDREARARNVEGAFAVGAAVEAKGQRVLLVDDVLTTGATAGAAAQALLDAGVQAVRVFTVARAE